MKLLRRLLAYEEIGPDIGRPLYLRRWRLLGLPGSRRVYLHQFVAPDWFRHLHDHPKWFLSIGLWGSYVEEVPFTPRSRRLTTWRFFTAPWIRWFPATHIHRISEIGPRGCWTLVVTGRETRAWGFYVDGEWIPWERYERLQTERRAA